MRVHAGPYRGGLDRGSVSGRQPRCHQTPGNLCKRQPAVHTSLTRAPQRVQAFQSTTGREQSEASPAPSNGTPELDTQGLATGSQVEMFVADGELPSSTNRSGSASGSLVRQKSRRTSVLVAPPRTQSPLATIDVEDGPRLARSNSDVFRPAQSTASRELKAELSVASAEVRSLSSELLEARQSLRQTNTEVKLLRFALAERDRRLDNTKTQLLAARRAAADKDDALRKAYEQLTAACHERSDLREQLVDSQTELADTRTELQQWTQEMRQLQDFINTASTDEQDETAQEAGPARAGWPFAGTSSANGAAAQRETGPGQKGGSDADTDRSEGLMLSAYSLLHDLNELSKQVVADAAKDGQVFQQAGDAHGQPLQQSM